jgi:putative membrane protein
MKFLLVAAATLLLAPPAGHAQSLSEKSGVNSTQGVAPTTRDFIVEAAINDMFEIESSRLAVTDGDSRIKPFAEKMIADHRGTSNELNALAGSGKVNVVMPTALDKTHQSMLDKLKGLKGSEFVNEFESQQLSAHKDAVSLFDRYSQDGGNASIRGFAAKTLPKLQEHLSMAQDLK